MCVHYLGAPGEAAWVNVGVSWLVSIDGRMLGSAGWSVLMGECWGQLVGQY